MVIQDIGGVAWARRADSSEYTLLNEQGSTSNSTYLTIFQEHIDDFINSIKKGRSFDADGWAGLRHMEIDGAIGESIITGKPVKVERYMPEKGYTI